MAVQALGKTFGQDGHKKTVAETWRAHVTNSNALLNLTEGKDAEEPREPYYRGHPDNQWPVMVYHPAKGELTIGKNLKGVTKQDERVAIIKQNQQDLKDALAGGYRKEPYPVVKALVMDPATEKAAALAREQELRGQNTMLADLVTKLSTRLDAMEAGRPPAK